MQRIEGDGGVEVAVRSEGQGPPVLLIHGFPDSSRLWRHQIAALAGAGFQAIAPDLRGLGESDRPEDVEAYRLAHSVADMVAVLDVFGARRAHVVGHDFGAVVAWALAAFVPDRVDRLVVLSVGHPAAAAVHRTIEAREKAWYQLLFQFEGVAEDLLRKDDWRLAREWLRGGGDADRSLEDLSRPGALTAGLNWYRANLHPSRELAGGSRMPPVRGPVLGLWSSGDHYLAEAGMAHSGAYVETEFRYERIEGASHWLQLDEAERVNRLLLDFLGA